MSTRQITNVLVIIGGDYHDFKTCGDTLKNFLEATDRIKVTLTEDRNALKKDSIQKFDAVIIYTQGGNLTEEQLNVLTSFVKRGGGLVGIHCASDSFRENRPYIEMLGSEFSAHGPHHEFPVNIVKKGHRITTRLSDFSITDELYTLKYNANELDIILTASWLGKSEPMVYTKSYGEGKVVYTALGHGIEAFVNQYFQKLVIRSIDWVTGKEENEPIKCGVIGYGGAFNMGKFHADFINKTDGLSVVAICDKDPERVKVAQKDYPKVSVFQSVDTMLESTNINLAFVVTPHNTHASVALKCLEQGKHVVVEKPMCLTVKEATSMIEKAKDKRVMLSVFHNRRWDPDFLTIKDIIQKGLIGNVFQIEASCCGYGHPGFWWRSDKLISGGILYDWGAHYIDWILNIIPDKIASVTGIVQKRVWYGVTNEDQGEIFIKFQSGTTADFQISSIAAIQKPKWRILGEKGGILLPSEGDKQAITVKYYTKGTLVTMEVPLQFKDVSSQLHPYYINIADHLIFEEPLLVKPEEARRVIAIIEGAQHSAKSGNSEPVALE